MGGIRRPTRDEGEEGEGDERGEEVKDERKTA